MSERQNSSQEGSLRIFICYRRNDSAGHAGRLYDRLAQHFGASQIFMDVDTIKPGEDFVSVITREVGSCSVLLAVIGRRWATAAAAITTGLVEPNDFVRLEIATALRRNVWVIPVLVQGAAMPRRQDLPDELSRLARLNALEVSDTRWTQDVERLIKVIEDRVYRHAVSDARATPALGPNLTGGEKRTPAADVQPHSFTKRKRLVSGIASLLLLLLAGITFLYYSLLNREAPPEINKTVINNTNSVEPANVGEIFAPKTDVNLRSGPSRTFPSIGLVGKDSRVRVLQVSGTWFEVEVLEHSRPKEDPASQDRGWLNSVNLKPVAQ